MRQGESEWKPLVHFLYSVTTQLHVNHSRGIAVLSACTVEVDAVQRYCRQRQQATPTPEELGSMVTMHKIISESLLMLQTYFI